MDHETYKIWNRIENAAITDNGQWINYIIENENGRSDLVLYNTKTEVRHVFKNSKGLKVDHEMNFLAFRKSADPDTIKAMKRRKVKKKKLPKDTLVFFDPKTAQISKVENIKSFKTSQDHSGWIAYQLEPVPTKKDSTLIKDENKENGSALTLYNFMTGKKTVIPFCLKYGWSKENGKLYATSTGSDTLEQTDLIIFDAQDGSTKSVKKIKGDFHNINFDKKGNQLAYTFSKDEDTEAELWKYDLTNNSSKSILSSASSTFLKSDWEVSKNFNPYFLEHQDFLVFGINPKPLEEDTTRLKEETVELDIWHYKDPYLIPRQILNADKDAKRSYTCTYNLGSGQLLQIGDLSKQNVSIDEKLKGAFALVQDDQKYRHLQSWEGISYRDIFLHNIKNGKSTPVAKKVAGQARLSTKGNFLLWYDRVDTTWVSYNIQSQRQNTLSKAALYDELNDRPMHPGPSGRGPWVGDDKVLLYDHYDIWLYDLDKASSPVRLTQGREQQTRYRYLTLDREVLSLPADTTILISSFNENNKDAGIGYLELDNGNINLIEKGPYRYTSNILKAKDTDDLVFTKESFDLFPDLIYTSTSFADQKKISDVNPQQRDYAWGSIEIYDWTDNNGNKRQALLAKPDNFNPAKKYPLIVNFYEKSSNRLHNHREPYPHRSTINYSYYTNQGYVIFNPDVYYTNGYPGESAYQTVMTSVDQLLEGGFIDESNMGLQGHSWGGYQIAYILTKTDRFKCAESGAPVVNMTSAYGGIRWGSGRSRMFQYEHTQSRIGATLWERPDLYLYNSPLFQLDKMNTPVLILHNDADGAVPWYQGIEYFVALRRLDKPSWLLNYNGEPHWPVKKQNRMDFNIRMQQFFDHYLKGKEMPPWMRDGLPTVNKGKDDGLGISKP